MKVTKFSMGEERMLECHYKFGVYEEPRQEPRQTEPEGNFNTDQEFPVFDSRCHILNSFITFRIDLLLGTGFHKF